MTLSPLIFTEVIDTYFPEPHSSLLNGILFGVPIRKSYGLYEQLRTVGLLHIVVLSGLNISILAAFISLTTLKFGKQVSNLITVLGIFLFIIFVGPQAPIIRAGFMGILTFVSIMYGRRTLSLYTLLLSILFIAIFWPDWLKSISFYLSYAATLGILLFAGPSTTSLHKKPLPTGWFRIWSFVKDDLKISLAAQIFTTPIIFIYFKQVSIVAPLSNLLISFIIPPLMIFGFLTAFLGKIHLALGLIPAYISYGILTYVIFVVESLSKLPFIYFKF